jgi:hypothetical protein
MWSDDAPLAAPATPVVSAPVTPVVVARPPRRWPIILVFCLLAGLIPETIITTSTSVAKIAGNPISLVFIALFYGAADLVIREAIIRRPLGVVGTLLMGAAFGFVNEGVVAGTWYGVRPDGYMYVHGVDWSWAVSLTVFHIFISVLLPIYLIDIIFPSMAGIPLLRRRGVIGATILFVGFSALATLAPTHRGQRMLLLVVALALALVALRLPPARLTEPPADGAKPAPGLWRLRALGFLAMLLYFLCIYALPFLVAGGKHGGARSPLPGLLANAILVALAAWAVALCMGWARRPGWSQRHQLALITGVFAFATLLSLIAPEERAVGEPLITIPFMVFLVFLVFLVILARRARRDERRAAPVPFAAPITGG